MTVGWRNNQLGWAKERKIKKKLTPYLVPYDELPEEIKERIGIQFEISPYSRQKRVNHRSQT